MDFCFSFIFKTPKHCLKEYAAYFLFFLLFTDVYFPLLHLKGWFPYVLGNLRTVVENVSLKAFFVGETIVCNQKGAWVQREGL